MGSSFIDATGGSGGAGWISLVCCMYGGFVGLEVCGEADLQLPVKGKWETENPARWRGFSLAD
jgi:hypothetical protein